MSSPARVATDAPSAAPRPVTTETASPGRYDSLDAARAISVLLMIAVHFVGTEGGANALERGLTAVLAAIQPTFAALFCVLAGISWSIQAERVGVTPAFRRYLAGRALALGSFGLLFHVLLWRTEILSAFALMMAVSVLVLGRGRRVIAIALVLFIALTPLVRLLLGEYATADWSDDGLHAADRDFGWATARYLLFDGNFPLFSWMAFPLMGMLFQAAAPRSRKALLAWSLGAAAVAVAAYAVRSAVATPDASSVETGWTPTSATFLLTAGGGAVAIVAAMLLWQGTSPMPRLAQPLVLFGRASLSHYVLHIAVGYSILRVMYPGEDWPVRVGMVSAVIYLAVTTPLAARWFRHHAHGPFEELWARAARRPPSRAAMPTTPGDGLEIRSSGSGSGLFARRRFARGEVVLAFSGDIRREPSRYSIQLGPDAHLHPPADVKAPWTRLNHSCSPNVIIDAPRRRLVATRAIAPGDELRFDYNTTEWDMAAPFPCGCGAPACIGVVKGFRHLPARRQRRLLSSAAPHVRELHSATRSHRVGDAADRSPDPRE